MKVTFKLITFNVYAALAVLALPLGLWDLDLSICHAVRSYSISVSAQVEIGIENFIYFNAQVEEHARAPLISVNAG